MRTMRLVLSNQLQRLGVSAVPGSLPSMWMLSRLVELYRSMSLPSMLTSFHCRLTNFMVRRVWVSSMFARARVCFPSCRVVLRNADDVLVQRMWRELLGLRVLCIWHTKNYHIPGPVFKCYVIA